MRITPPLILTEDQADEIVAAVTDSLRAIETAA
jgi:4-aminobutyrate aminotransferase-like enzyme